MTKKCGENGEKPRKQPSPRGQPMSKAVQGCVIGFFSALAVSLWKFWATEEKPAAYRKIT
jgi:hypothetical protein